jgi:hypothetical protein
VKYSAANMYCIPALNFSVDSFITTLFVLGSTFILSMSRIQEGVVIEGSAIVSSHDLNTLQLSYF